MKLVIDIPEERYEEYKRIGDSRDILFEAICKGKPLDESFEWCHGCKEYDNERHCCPRWTKVIRTTLWESIDCVLEEIKAEIPKLTCGDNEYRQAIVKVADVIKCIDKHKAEGSGEK